MKVNEFAVWTATLGVIVGIVTIGKMMTAASRWLHHLKFSTAYGGAAVTQRVDATKPMRSTRRFE
jgi:hypothetical protein